MSDFVDPGPWGGPWPHDWRWDLHKRAAEHNAPPRYRPDSGNYYGMRIPRRANDVQLNLGERGRRMRERLTRRRRNQRDRLIADVHTRFFE